MTSLDVLGGISSVLQILQTSFDIAGRLIAAADKTVLIRVLNSNRDEVASLRDIVAVVKDEESLQTRSIISAIEKLGDLSQRLEDLLLVMEDSDFVGRFQHSKSQREELQALTNEITAAKLTLITLMQGAHVGLIRSVDNKFAVQINKLNGVDANLRKLIHGFEGLLICEIASKKTPQADGTVTLDPSDLEELEVELSAETTSSGGSRLIDNNMTYGQSIMINGTIGTEGFIEPKDVRIRDNKSHEQSTMINTSISHQIWQDVRQDRMRAIEMNLQAGHDRTSGESTLLTGTAERNGDSEIEGRNERT